MTKPQDEFRRLTGLVRASAFTKVVVDTSSETHMMKGIRTALDNARPTRWLATLHHPAQGVIALYETNGSKTICLVFPNNENVPEQAVKLFCLIWDQLQEDLARAVLRPTMSSSTLTALMVRGELHWMSDETSIAHLFA